MKQILIDDPDIKGNNGFTLIELMISLAIMGILIASAVPAYQTFQQRARGQEAVIMAKQIIEGQILYYLENNKFYPELGAGELYIPDTEDEDTEQNIKNVKEWLNIEIPKDRPLEYIFLSYNSDGLNQFLLTVKAEFALFQNDVKELQVQLTDKGEVTWLTGLKS